MTSPPPPPSQTILLKTRSTPTDAYSSLPSPTFVPVLTHTLLPSALSTLTTLLTAPSTSPTSLAHYGGLILTSQRAVEALGAAFAQIDAQSPANKSPTNQPSTFSTDQLLSHYDGIVYVVGPATGRAVRSLLAQRMPRARVDGEQAGNGAALAAHILSTYQRDTYQRDTSQRDTHQQDTHQLDPRKEGRPRQPLLFLVGEQRRDVIPRTLQDAGLPAAERVQVEEMVVYETREREGFGGEFGGVVERIGGSAVRWVVVFSPTGCGAMLGVLGWLGEGGRFEEERRGGGVYVASIGPTTREFLRSEFGFEVDVCAEEPSPEGVRRGVEEFMTRLNGG